MSPSLGAFTSKVNSSLSPSIVALLLSLLSLDDVGVSGVVGVLDDLQEVVDDGRHVRIDEDVGDAVQAKESPGTCLDSILMSMS